MRRAASQLTPDISFEPDRWGTVAGRRFPTLKKWPRAHSPPLTESSERRVSAWLCRPNWTGTRWREKKNPHRLISSCLFCFFVFLMSYGELEMIWFNDHEAAVMQPEPPSIKFIPFHSFPLAKQRARGPVAKAFWNYVMKWLGRIVRISFWSLPPGFWVAPVWIHCFTTPLDHPPFLKNQKSKTRNTIKAWQWSYKVQPSVDILSSIKHLHG